MSTVRGFKQKMMAILRLCEAEDYDAALAKVESLQQSWPGNAQLYILWANLALLQKKPKHDLAKVKRSLQQAVALDQRSPEAAIELGRFLDNIEDHPRAAAKVFAEAIADARQLLLDGLIGQAKVFVELHKKAAFMRCVREALQLIQFQDADQLPELQAAEIQALLREANANGRKNGKRPADAD